MIRILMTILTVVFIVGSSIAVHAIHDIVPSETVAPEPGPDAGRVNEYIIKYNPYRAWSLWPGKGRLYKAKEPLGLVTTFVNDKAYHSIKKKKGMADGSIIVTENYSADKKFLALFVMYRIKGYNPDGGDWFWAQYAPDGKVEASGKVKACIECHASKKNNDHIFTGEVKK